MNQFKQLLTPEEFAERRKIGGKKGGGSRAEKQIYFNRSPDMPEIECRNIDSPSHESFCTLVARVGFATCQGCADRSKFKASGVGKFARAAGQ